MKTILFFVLGYFLGAAIVFGLILFLSRNKKTKKENNHETAANDYEMWLKTQTKLDKFLREYYNQKVVKTLKLQCVDGGKKDAKKN